MPFATQYTPRQLLGKVCDAEYEGAIQYVEYEGVRCRITKVRDAEYEGCAKIALLIRRKHILTYQLSLGLNRERSKYAKYGLIMKRDTPRNWLGDGWMLLDDARWSALKREKRAKRARGNAKCESVRKCCAYGAFCRRAVHYIAEVAYGVGQQVREKRAKRVRECCALCGEVARLWRVSRESGVLFREVIVDDGASCAMKASCRNL
ncbi:hypothetical protein DFJ58DRAFT_846099 [Suillus subalutaceus]|uniref:uncharacterized protein n=1 Tax=Suillus subalutaceus TaxID=48586 RepID=UPI001B879963|nr:uncharacterized protein DFJ58DRAFT_846099 [Suillus subalutaceus]KAG1838386.1 hypothetical protein DFJ58DRAFT_846099 [Suillus subalutaceus]